MNENLICHRLSFCSDMMLKLYTFITVLLGQSLADSTEHRVSPRNGVFGNLINPGPKPGFGPNQFHGVHAQSQSSRERPIVIYAEVVNIDQSRTNEEKAFLPPTPIVINALPLPGGVGFLGNIGRHYPVLGGSLQNPFVPNIPVPEYPDPFDGNIHEADLVEPDNLVFSMGVADLTFKPRPFPFEVQPMSMETDQPSFNNPLQYIPLNNENAALRPIQNNYMSMPLYSSSSTEPASSVESQKQEREHTTDVNTLLQEYLFLKGLIDKENHKLPTLNEYTIPSHQTTLNSGTTNMQPFGPMQNHESMEESTMTKKMEEKPTTIAPSTVKVPPTLSFKIPTPRPTTEKPEYKIPKLMSELPKPNEAMKPHNKN